MERLSEILNKSQKYSQSLKTSRNTEPSYKDFEQSGVDAYNASEGSLEGYDCKVCKNKGYIMFLDNGHERVRHCECMKIRQTMKRIENSGLKNLLEKCTFENFETRYEWQKKSKSIAIKFLEDYEGNWFFAGGQVGCGKTHLCTAIVGEFIKRGKAARYMLWRDDIVKLKASVTDDEAYDGIIGKLKDIEVLYIDDFFKTERGKNPTSADVNIAFEILNYRYNNPKLITIISSERLIDNVIEIDEAVGSRIYQRSRDYCLTIAYDRSKNYRLNGGDANV